MNLVLGSLDLLILKALTWGPSHGYGIAAAIGDRTDGAIVVEDAALYKALHRLERAGYVEARWGASENKRRARYYRLTVSGRAQLRAETARWKEYGAAVLKLINAGQ